MGPERRTKRPTLLALGLAYLALRLVPAASASGQRDVAAGDLHGNAEAFTEILHRRPPRRA